MHNRNIVLITGVSRELGLGFEVARQLAQMRHQVIISARQQEKASKLAKQLKAEGLNVSALQLDVMEEKSVNEAVSVIERDFGGLDILINNAAGGFDIEQSVLQPNFDIVHTAIETNFVGPWRLVTAVLPLLKRSKQGRIVNVSSEAASFGSPSGLQNTFIGELLPAYSISKNALNALTVKLAQALKDTGILVNAVCPGQTATHPETEDEDDARPASESAKGIIWAATLPTNGPSGGFFRDGIPLQW